MVARAQWEWLQQWKQRNWQHRGRPIWAAALWIKEADGMSQVKSAWQAEKNCRAHPCCCEAALAATAGQAEAVQLYQYSSPTARATSQAANKMTSLQPTQLGGWLLLPLLLFNFFEPWQLPGQFSKAPKPHCCVLWREKKIQQFCLSAANSWIIRRQQKQNQTLNLKRKNHPKHKVLFVNRNAASERGKIHLSCWDTLNTISHGQATTLQRLAHRSIQSCLTSLLTTRCCLMKGTVQKIQGWLQEVYVFRPAFPTEVTDWKQTNMCNTDTNIMQHLSTRKKSVSGEWIQTRATQPEAELNRAWYRQSNRP